MNGFLQDLRLGARGLLRRPAFAAVASGTLALGIGATVAVFSLVSAVLLKPLPYPRSEDLYLVRGVDPAFPEALVLSWPNYDDVRRGVGPRFASISASRPVFLNLTEGERAERVVAARVTPGLLTTLGAAPFLGRDFTREEGEPGGPDVLLLTHGFWKSRFAADRSLVGRTIRLEGKPFLVAGILPPSVSYPDTATQLWIPMQPVANEKVRGANALRVLARLAPNAALPAAASELDGIGRRLAKEYPHTNAGLTFRMKPLQEDLVGKTRRPLLILQAAAALLLAIASVNVANLLLVRAAARRQELAVRSALGGSRARIVRQFLTESLALAASGGAIGIALAAAGVRFLKHLPPATLPRAAEVVMDVRVMLFSVALSAATAIAVGLVPALRVTEHGLSDDLRSGRRGATRGGRERGVLAGLVVAEVALALLLMAASGLLLQSFLHIRRVDPGFEPRGLWAATVGLSTTRYPNPAAHVRYFEETVARLSAMPGVSAVAVMGRLPLANFSGSTSYQVNDHRRPDGKEPTADYVAVSPGFFETMKIPVLSGRPITDRDRADAPRAVLVNRAFARREWPSGNAVGKSLEVYTDDGKMREIVGVVADVNLRGLDEPPDPTIYVSLAQNAFPQHLRSGSFLVRFEGDAAAGNAAARESLARYDPEQSVTPFRPMEDVVEESLSSRRLNLGLTLLFGALAATLAGVGISAVMAHSVGQRRQEIGVRMALGANARMIVRMIVTDGVRLAALGIAAGLLGAVSLTRVLSGLLFGIGPRDPGVFSGVAIAVLAIAVTAVWIPARRAAAVDPVRALAES